MSSRRFRLVCAGLGLFAATALRGQYPGQINNKSADKPPELRAVAVLEWTGEAGKPKACRIVPITIYDGEKLQDGGLYLARPEPLALAGEVEYELKQNGKTFGIFDVKNSGQEEGSWVGYGEWKDVPKPKTDVAAAPKKIDDEGDPDDDKPVLHRKHSDDSSTASTSDSKTSASASDDSDRPKLHKKTDDSADSSSTSDSGHPTLHKKTDDSASDTTADNSSSSAPIDPDRPVMKEPKKKHGKAPEDLSGVSSLSVTDPDRPRLKHGMSNADSLRVLPSLMGLPPDMQQAVAVSDALNHPDHPWTYTWANPGDEAKMKSQMEDIARQALGIAAPAATPAPAVPAKAAVARRATSKKPAKPATPPPPPATLDDEQFRVFELTYGSGATMVLTAHTSGPLAQEKFVTLIAQPDLYGNVLVLLKNVTDGSHLDETPWMRLVDAVDVLADNRGELLFELRGETSREFALYRVLRGRADKLFVSFAGNFGVPTTD